MLFLLHRPRILLEQAGIWPDDVVVYAATPRADGSIVLAGLTDGDWAGGPVGITDFAAVALDEDGEELWRYQVCEHRAPGCTVKHVGTKGLRQRWLAKSLELLCNAQNAITSMPVSVQLHGNKLDINRVYICPTQYFVTPLSDGYTATTAISSHSRLCRLWLFLLLAVLLFSIMRCFRSALCSTFNHPSSPLTIQSGAKYRVPGIRSLLGRRRLNRTHKGEQ